MKLKEFIWKLSRLDPELDVLICAEEPYGYGTRWDEPLFEEDCKDDDPSYDNIKVYGDILYIGD